MKGRNKKFWESRITCKLKLNRIETDRDDNKTEGQNVNSVMKNLTKSENFYLTE